MKKIPTIFKRNPADMREMTSEHHPDCSWVFSGEGVATRKYDGTCCLIENGKLYKRREVKKGTKIPNNFAWVGYDHVTGKTVGWVRVNLDSKENRWHAEGFLNPGYEFFVDDDGTYELIGPKIQGNPEKYEDHTLIKHSDSETYPDAPREFTDLSEWLKDKDIEGLVFHHPDGRMAKIKKRDFGQSR